jgi:KUP system potassium uptake protein
MPNWFIIPGVLIATVAAIIASQAMIAGAFTLISEAMRLNLWPRFKIQYPSEERGQLFIPFMNMFMFAGCVFVVLYFRESSKMEAAYGLAIIVTMIMTTILFANYLVLHRVKSGLIYLFIIGYLIIEFAYLVALLDKFMHGGYITLILGLAMFIIMYVWYRARKVKNRYVEFARLEHYVPMLQELSNDLTVTKYSTHLVYLTSANNPKEIEHKIIYSILQKQPKRADNYWFVHVNVTKSPYTCEYKVNTISKNDVYRITFNLGFKVEEKISQFLRIVIEDMVKKGEVTINSPYHSLKENNIAGDFRFVILEEILSTENQLDFKDRLAIKINLWLKNITTTPEKWFNLDSNLVMVEKVPLLINSVNKYELLRVN